MFTGGIARLRSCTTTFSHVSEEFATWSASALSSRRFAVFESLVVTRDAVLRDQRSRGTRRRRAVLDRVAAFARTRRLASGR